MTGKTLIVYHANCVDGVTSAWVAAKACTKHKEFTIALAAGYNKASHNKIISLVEEESVHSLIMVDYSVPIQILAELRNRYPGLQIRIIDHHKSAFEMYDPGTAVHSSSVLHAEIEGAVVTLSNSDCGASLAWKILADGAFDHIPELISYVKDYDLWRFELGAETKFVNKVLAGYIEEDNDIGTLFHKWDLTAAALEHPLDRKELLMRGEELQVAHDKEVDVAVSEATPVIFCGSPAMITAAHPSLASDVGHRLADSCKGIGITYSIDFDARRPEVKYSLRSIGELDVSRIAKMYNGGGHKNAAGFVSTALPEDLRGIIDYAH